MEDFCSRFGLDVFGRVGKIREFAAKRCAVHASRGVGLKVYFESVDVLVDELVGIGRLRGM